MMNRTNTSTNHYAILLSRIHQFLGDLQMTDENYMGSALEYRNSIAYLKEMLYQKEIAKIIVEETLPSAFENRITKLAEYICPIIEIVARKSILYLYAHNENISIAEIQDLKGLFSLKPYENISLEKLSLYPDIEEILMLSVELKIYCYKHFNASSG